MEKILESGKSLEKELEGIGQKIEVTSNQKQNIKRNARDRYESDQAGVRETVNNAITAGYKARDKGYIEDIDVSVTNDGEEISIEDNGIGMTSDHVRNILSKMGITDSRQNGEWIGYFGVGFFAVFRLSGGNEVTIKTKSRETEEEIIINTDLYDMELSILEEEDEGYGEMDYGTKIIVPLKDSIIQRENDIIKEWLDETFEKSRVNIDYENYNTGVEITFGGSLEDKSKLNNKPADYIYHENEHFELIAGNEVEDEFYLLDTSIKQPKNIKLGRISGLFGRDSGIGFRLKTETPTVVAGKHKGKKVVSRENYESLNDKSEYVTEKDLTIKDIVTPKPTDTRDDFNENQPFWNWLKYYILDVTIEQMSDYYSDIETFEDLASLSKKEIENILTLDERNRDPNSSYNHSEFFSNDSFDFLQRDSNRNYVLSNFEQIELLGEFVNKSKINMPYDTDIEKYKLTSSKFSSSIIEILKEGLDSNKNIYFGASIHEKKRKAILQNMSGDNILFRVPTSMYDVLEELGFNKAKNIPKDKYKDIDTTYCNEYSLKPGGKTYKERSLKKKIKQNNEEYIVFYPSGRNITDNENLQTNGYNRDNKVRAFNCPTKSKAEEFVKKYSNCYFVEDYVEEKTAKIYNSELEEVSIEVVEPSDEVLFYNGSTREQIDDEEFFSSVIESGFSEDAKIVFDKESLLILRKRVEFEESLEIDKLSYKRINKCEINKNIIMEKVQESEDINEDFENIFNNLSKRYNDDSVEMLELLTGENIKTL